MTMHSICAPYRPSHCRARSIACWATMRCQSDHPFAVGCVIENVSCVSISASTPPRKKNSRPEGSHFANTRRPAAVIRTRATSILREPAITRGRRREPGVDHLGHRQRSRAAQPHPEAKSMDWTAVSPAF
jgi:hypothetical protein